ncbi:MAG: SMP-30/gluconolactonase/LRE family protein [Pirellulales bacterium]
MLRHALVMLSFLAATGSAFLELAAAAEQGRGVPPTVGSIERLDPRFDALVPPGTVIETLAMGFAWSEGPVWVASDKGGLPAGCLLFSDIPNNRVHRWQPGKGLDIFMEPAGFTGPAEYGRERGSNGLTLDAAGRLVLCEHGDRRLSRLEPGGGKKTLVDAYRGKRLNSPNDLAIHSSGAIYFTDPPYGLPQGWDDPRRELDFCGVYRLAADGTLTLECDTMTRPNGIAFSPDEKTLYVAQSDPAAPIWRAFAVAANGTLADGAAGGRVFFDASDRSKTRRGLPDGLKVDTAGNVFATGPGGVLVFAPDGTHLGTLLTGQATANCSFGEDGSSLFITADSLLCRVRLATAGPLPGT